MFSNSKKKAAYLKSEIRYLISTGLSPFSYIFRKSRKIYSSALVDITGNPKAVMQYTRYEEDIVLRYGVELVGWTYENFVNPSELSTSLGPLTTLFNALKSGECKFIKLSLTELREREAKHRAKETSGEVVLKRKRRADAGKPRKKAKKGKAAEIDADDVGSDGDDGA